jgi:hypothetical protein
MRVRRLNGRSEWNDSSGANDQHRLHVRPFFIRPDHLKKAGEQFR